MKRLLGKINDYFYKIIASNTLFILLAVLSIFPLVLLSFFNNPGSDDFEYGFETQVGPFFALQIRRYFDWSGRYFSNGLLSLDPLVCNNYLLFKIVPIVLISFFIYSVYFFFKSLKIVRVISELFALVGLTTFLFIYQMPDICEGFFWMPGSIPNLLPVILTLFCSGFFIKYHRSNKFICFVLCALLLFGVLGSNEISVVNLCFLTSFILVFNYYVSKKINVLFLSVFIFIIIFSLIEVLAPGNYVRGENILVKHRLGYSIAKSIQTTFSLITEWIPIMVLCCFFLFNDILKMVEERIERKYLIHPILSFLLMISVVFIGIFVGVWSLNTPPPDRSINTIYFYFIITFFYFIITVVYYLANIKRITITIHDSVKKVIGILIILNFISDNPIVLAYHDLFSGKAYKYDKEMQNRFYFLQKTKDMNCVLPVLMNKPPTIYNEVDMGLTNDKNNWKNLEISEYFRKESIIIKPTDTLKTE